MTSPRRARSKEEGNDSSISDHIRKLPHPSSCHGTGDRDFQVLQRHLQKRGADVENVRIGTFEDGLRGLQTNRFFKRGQVILSVPWELTLSAATFSGSQAAAALTASWAAYENGDQMLEVLALLYESVVVGGGRGRHHSQWAPYICTLPLQYSLPLNFTDPWARALVSSLPDVSRLMVKRREALSDFGPRIEQALRGLPGGSAALSYLVPGQWESLLMWAYSATKTRTISFDLEEASGPSAQLGLAPGYKRWVQELGVMVPLLDLVNHGSVQEANSAYRTVTTDSTTSFQLYALRKIPAGEQVRFSYIDEEEAISSSPPHTPSAHTNAAAQATTPTPTPASHPHPIQFLHCHDRWLQEYGFIMGGDMRPGRQCYAWNLTVEGVAEAMRPQGLKQAAGLWGSAQYLSNRGGDVSVLSGVHVVDVGPGGGDSLESGGSALPGGFQQRGAGDSIVGDAEAVAFRVYRAGYQPWLTVRLTTAPPYIPHDVMVWLRAAVGGGETAGRAAASVLHQWCSREHGRLVAALGASRAGSGLSRQGARGGKANGQGGDGVWTGGQGEGVGKAGGEGGDGQAGQDSLKVMVVLVESALRALEGGMRELHGQGLIEGSMGKEL
ncbi:MAG: hypothetical protein WDW38_006221 [Sanguina aurantia]